jgi:hypothetical protein
MQLARMVQQVCDSHLIIDWFLNFFNFVPANAVACKTAVTSAGEQCFLLLAT